MAQKGKVQQWTGILKVNNGVQHAIFDVQCQSKQQGSTKQMKLFTKDLPPIPILQPTDQLNIEFYLENCLTTVTEASKQLVVEETFHGNFIDPKQLGVQCAIRTEKGEWQFLKTQIPNSDQVTPWFVSEICLVIPPNRVKTLILER